MLTEYAEFLADRNEEVEEMALSKQPAIASRLRHLMYNPTDRDLYILDDILNTSYLEDLEAHGNEVLADAFWGEVEALSMLTWDELLASAAGNKSTVIEAAKKVVFSSAQVQAQIESGIPQKAMMDGKEGFEIRDKATKDLTPDEKRNIKLDVKGVIKRRAKESK